jgi:hypothetical protein
MIEDGAGIVAGGRRWRTPGRTGPDDLKFCPSTGAARRRGSRRVLRRERDHVPALPNAGDAGVTVPMK